MHDLSRMAKRVLHEVAHHPLQQAGVTDQLHGPDGAGVDGDRVVGAQRGDRGVDDVVEVHECRPEPGGVGVGAGQDEQLVDEALHPAGLVEHVALLGPTPLPGRLQLHAQARDRAAQLVRGVGDEAPLLLGAVLQPPQHLVDGAGQPADLVVLDRHGDPLVEVLAGDGVRPGPDRFHGRKGAADGQPHHGPEHQHEERDAHRADLRRRLHRVLQVADRDGDEDGHRARRRVDPVRRHAIGTGAREAAAAAPRRRRPRPRACSGRSNRFLSSRPSVAVTSLAVGHDLRERLGVLRHAEAASAGCRRRPARPTSSARVPHRVVGNIEELGPQGDQDQDPAERPRRRRRRRP